MTLLDSRHFDNTEAMMPGHKHSSRRTMWTENIGEMVCQMQKRGFGSRSLDRMTTK